MVDALKELWEQQGRRSPISGEPLNPGINMALDCNRVQGDKSIANSRWITDDELRFYKLRRNLSENDFKRFFSVRPNVVLVSTWLEPKYRDVFQKLAEIQKRSITDVLTMMLRNLAENVLSTALVGVSLNAPTVEPPPPPPPEPKKLQWRLIIEKQDGNKFVLRSQREDGLLGEYELTTLKSAMVDVRGRNRHDLGYIPEGSDKLPEGVPADWTGW